MVDHAKTYPSNLASLFLKFTSFSCRDTRRKWEILDGIPGVGANVTLPNRFFVRRIIEIIENDENMVEYEEVKYDPI